jgi:hypothetical protein
MAELMKTFIAFGKTSAAVTFTAATGTDYFVPDNADGRVALIIKNSNTQSAAVTLKAGDGALAPLGDVKIAAGAGETVFLPLVRAETARVKVTTGADKGKVLVTTAVDTGGVISSVGIGVVSVQ